MIRNTKETRRLGRLLCLLLAFAMLLPSLAPAQAATSYGVVTVNNVLFRKAPNTSDFWARLYPGWVGEILGTETVKDPRSGEDVLWFKVKANLPHDLRNSFTGFMRSNVFRELTAAEQTAWLANPVQGSFGTGAGTGLPGPTGSSFAVITLAGAALRQTASATSVVIAGFLKDQVVTILEAPTDPVKGWYKATGGGYIGYIYAGHLRLITAAEAASLAGGAPTGGQPAAGASGYALITQSGTNLRRTPNGESQLQLSINTRVPYFGAPQAKDGYDWLYVRDPVTGYFGYVRSDCYRIESATAPVPVTPDPTTQDGYIKITKHNVNLRRTPGGDTQLQIVIDTVLPYFGAPIAALGYYWVYVKHNNGTFGYVRSDCYTFVDAAGNKVDGPAQPSIPTQPTPVTPPSGGSSGQIRLVRGGVNLRKSPGGTSFAQLDRNTVLPYYGFAQQGGYTWYYVMSAIGAGYVRSDMAVMHAGGGTPGTPVTPPTGSVLGYVITTKTGANLRQSASSAAPIYKQLKLSTVLPLVGQVSRNQGYNWYFVNADGRTGYLRSDVVRQLSAAEVTAYLAGTMPGTTPPTGGTPSPAAGYIRTTLDYVNIRLTPSLSATKLTQIAKAGAIFAFDGTVSSGGRLWYRMTYNGQVCYMLASLARELTPEEVARYLGGQPVVTPVPTPTTPIDPADLSSTALTIMNRVLVRQTPELKGKVISIMYTAGARVKLLGETSPADGYTFYKAQAGGVTGWVRGDTLRILSKAEEQKLNQVGDPDAPSEASYPTLSLGSTGAAVTRLQTELSRLNFLPAAGITGQYTSATVDAVKAYQLAAGLFVDGIAGANTQHRLYGTVPEGTYTGGGTGDLFPVEKVEWSQVTNIWRNGMVATITDVSTKLSFQAKRWSGLHHADVEPLTAADTAIMCRIYGVRNAQEIADKDLWQRRPVWVTVAGRSLAASVYGVPHNFPLGDTIAGNDFNGQFCVHFVNSTTHNNPGVVDRHHKAAIETAYSSAPSKK